MTIKLQIEVTSPISPEDHEMLSGIAVMTLAIANRHLAVERFPEAFGAEEQTAPSEEMDIEAADRAVEALTPEEIANASPSETPFTHFPINESNMCSVMDNDLICIATTGHKGRHRMRSYDEYLKGLN